MISIITPVYNGERFIESCIKNVISQDFSDMEHIIVDGGSTDRTVEIVKHYAAANPHIHWISEKDKGQSDAMNKGIAMAKGEIIGFLNVDDFYEVGTLNRVSELFIDLPEPSLLVANCRVLNDAGEVIHINKPNNLRLSYVYAWRTELPFNPASYFYHKSLHQEIDMYEIDENYAMDTIFILDALQKANVYYFDEVWGNYRQIEGTKTFESIQGGDLPLRHRRVLKAHFKKLPRFKQLLIGADSFYLFTVKGTLKNIRPLKEIWDKLKSFRQS